MGQCRLKFETLKGGYFKKGKVDKPHTCTLDVDAFWVIWSRCAMVMGMDIWVQGMANGGRIVSMIS